MSRWLPRQWIQSEWRDRAAPEWRLVPPGDVCMMKAKQKHSNKRATLIVVEDIVWHSAKAEYSYYFSGTSKVSCSKRRSTAWSFIWREWKWDQLVDKVVFFQVRISKWTWHQAVKKKKRSIYGAICDTRWYSPLLKHFRLRSSVATASICIKYKSCQRIIP